MVDLAVHRPKSDRDVIPQGNPASVPPNESPLGTSKNSDYARFGDIGKVGFSRQVDISKFFKTPPTVPIGQRPQDVGRPLPEHDAHFVAQMGTRLELEHRKMLGRSCFGEVTSQ